jgi:hypothetical protein
MVDEPALTTREPSEADLERERKRRDLAQLAASQRELVGAISRHVDWLLEMEAGGMLRSKEDMEREPFGPAEAHARAREPSPEGYEPGVFNGVYEPEHVSWHDLGTLIEHEPVKGGAVWGQTKQAARRDLATGMRAAEAMEPSRRTPWGRAQFLAIVDALVEDLKPRGALEYLMVQRMAAAYEQCLRWQQIAIRRQEEDVWRGEDDRRRALEGMTPAQRERHQQYEGWLPPRVSTAEAINQAGLMADRHERAFLRLIRAFRDLRRHYASIIVAGAGQVNIADQQVNLSAGNRSDSEL